jgi:hypothetical protein
MSSYWWCLTHSRVEDEMGCAHTDRLGPYATREEAARALQSARERTEAEDARDRADNDWGR